MKKVKISHEVPFCLLEKSREFNSYDYMLPHLMDENEEIYDILKSSGELDRLMADDNIREIAETGQVIDDDQIIPEPDSDLEI